MAKEQDDLLAQRKYFLLAGLVAGVLVSAWYLYRLHLQRVIPGVALKTDSVSAQCLNVALIMIAAFFQFSLLHKGVVLVVKAVRRKKKG